MLNLNLNISTGLVVALVAIFLFSCGFVAGYLFGSLANIESKKETVQKTGAKGVSAQ